LGNISSTGAALSVEGSVCSSLCKGSSEPELEEDIAAFLCILYELTYQSALFLYSKVIIH